MFKQLDIFSNNDLINIVRALQERETYLNEKIKKSYQQGTSERADRNYFLEQQNTTKNLIELFRKKLTLV